MLFTTDAHKAVSEQWGTPDRHRPGQELMTSLEWELLSTPPLPKIPQGEGKR